MARTNVSATDIAGLDFGTTDVGVGNATGAGLSGASAGGMTRQKMLARNTESEKKADWFTFIRHSYDGSGGFAPLVPSQDRSGTGAIPSMPSWWDGASYLVKHEGEELSEWYDRILNARYPNLARKAISAWLGLLLRRGVSRIKDKASAPLLRFLERADGAGRSWDDGLADASTRGVLGGCLTLVDRPNDTGAQNRAQAGGPAYVTHIDPDCLYDWSRDPWGRWEWAKIVEAVVEQPNAEDPPAYYWRCRIWYRDTWQVYLCPQSGSEEPTLVDEGINLLGEVPLVTLTYADAVGGDLFGWTPADELVCIARDDYQGISRHVELLEKQGFAILERPCREGEERKVAQMDVGAARAVATPVESSRGMSYVAPPDGPVASHERKHTNDGNEALRVMGLEQILSSTAAPASALERQYEFQTTNAALANYAKRVLRYDREVLRLVEMIDGATAEVAEADVYALQSEFPDDFDIRDRQADVAIAAAVMEFPGLDPYTQTGILRQISDSVVQLSPKEKKDRDKWLAAQLQRMTMPDAEVPTEKILTPTAASGVVTVNEARANIGLGPLLDADGKEDPDGKLTVDEFKVKREAGAMKGEEPEPQGFGAKPPPFSPSGPGAAPFDKGTPPTEPQIPG